MKNIDFKKMFGYIYPQGEEGVEIKPDRDWRLIFLLSAIIIVLLFLLNALVFWRFIQIPPAEPDFAGPKKIEEARLEKAVKILEKREERFEEHLKSKPSINNPS